MEERERQDNEILELKERMDKIQQYFKSYDERVKEVLGKVEDHIKWQHKNEEMRRNV